MQKRQLLHMPLCVILFVFSQAVAGQESNLPPWYYPTRTYTALDGLSQTYTYTVIQDAKGYIWVATREGFNRFDGRQFENHLTNDVFPDDLIYEIEEDKWQNIWFRGETGVYQYTGDTVITYPLPEFSSAVDKITLRNRQEPWMLNNEKLHAFRNGRFVEQALRLELGFVREFLVLESGDFLFNIMDRKTKKISLRWLDSQGREIVTKSINGQSFDLVDFDRHDKHIYIRLDQSIYLFDEGRLEKLVDAEQPFYTFAIRGDKIVIADRFRVYQYEQGKWKNYGLDLNYISDLFIDRQDRLWITTEEGLVKVESEALEYYPRERGMIRYPWTILEDDRKNTWFASYHYGLRILNEDLQYESPVKYPGFKEFDSIKFYTGGIKRRNGDLLFPAENKVVQFNPSDGFSALPGSTVSGRAFQDVKEYRDTLYLATRGLMIIPPDGVRRLYSDEEGLDSRKLGYIEALEVDKNGKVWMVSHLGMAVFEKNQFSNYYKGEELPGGLNCVLKDSRENLWFGGHNALFFYDYTSKLPRPIFQDTIKDLKGSIKFISAIDSSYLVLGMLDRLILLDLKSFYADQPNYYILDNENGFEGQDCIQGSGYADSRGHIWVATRNTVFKLIPEKIQWINTPASEVVFHSILAERPDKEKPAKVSIPIRRNAKVYTFLTKTSLQINFGAIDHANPEKTSFQHRLLGYDQNWSEKSARRFALFANLPPGNYVFEVKACINNNCSPPQKLPIRIVREQREQILRILTWSIPSILFLLTLSEIIQRRRARRQAQRLERELLSKELEHLKLRHSFLLNQAAPHFTFNILNAIAGLISQEKLLDARRYIGWFGDLFRPILFDNGKLTRSLQEEIEFVENYLMLEKLRFPNRFEYKLHLEKNVPLHAFVPKMVIQTFVNNAIKHGLESIHRGGRLQVSISATGSFIKITVEDNGIGRFRSLQNKSKDQKKKGRGILIMQDTFQWFNDQYPEKSDVNFIDLANQQGRTAGLRVELSIYAGYNNL